MLLIGVKLEVEKRGAKGQKGVLMDCVCVSTMAWGRQVVSVLAHSERGGGGGVGVLFWEDSAKQDLQLSSFAWWGLDHIAKQIDPQQNGS